MQNDVVNEELPKPDRAAVQHGHRGEQDCCLFVHVYYELTCTPQLRDTRRHVFLAAWQADRALVAVVQSKEQSFARRDLLLKIQEDAQKKWEQDKIFNAEPPAPGVLAL